MDHLAQGVGGSLCERAEGRTECDREYLAAWRSDAAQYLSVTCSFSLRSCSRSLASSSIVLAGATCVGGTQNRDVSKRDSTDPVQDPTRLFVGDVHCDNRIRTGSPFGPLPICLG